MCRRGDRSAPPLPLWSVATSQFLLSRSCGSDRTIHYGLRRSFNYLDYSRWSCHWRDRKAVDAGERSRRLHHYDSARHRRRACRHVARSPFYGRELRRRLDHVGRRRHGSVIAVSIALQARRISKQAVASSTDFTDFRRLHCKQTPAFITYCDLSIAFHSSLVTSHCSFMADPKRSRVLIAFASLYLIWGFTFLVIRVGIEMIMTLLMVVARIMVAGL